MRTPGAIFLKILNEGRCEIGTHCHPWNTPPLAEERSEYNSMLCNLPQTLIQDKLFTLDHAIQNWIGIKPTSFRAGRWGFDTKVAHTIHALGYTIDSSVTPLVSWQLYHGPDCEFAPHENYRFDPAEIFRKAESGAILEVQPTIGYLRGDQGFCRAIRRKILNSRLSRLHLLGLLGQSRNRQSAVAFSGDEQLEGYDPSDPQCRPTRGSPVEFHISLQFICCPAKVLS